MRLRRWCRKPVANENITREFFGSPHCCKVPNVPRLQDSSRQSAPNITPQYFRRLFSVNCLRYAANVLTQLTTTIDDHERHRLFPPPPPPRVPDPRLIRQVNCLVWLSVPALKATCRLCCSVIVTTSLLLFSLFK